MAGPSHRYTGATIKMVVLRPLTKTKGDNPVTIHTDPAGHVLGARLHPETHDVLHRDVRPEVLSSDGNKVVVEVPGWYPDDSGNAVFSDTDD